MAELLTGADVERALQTLIERIHVPDSKNDFRGWWVMLSYKGECVAALGGVRRISKRALRAYQNHPRVCAAVGTEVQDA